MNSFLVREALGFSEFVEAILLLINGGSYGSNMRRILTFLKKSLLTGGGPKMDGTMGKKVMKNDLKVSLQLVQNLDLMLVMDLWEAQRGREHRHIVLLEFLLLIHPLPLR